MAQPWKAYEKSCQKAFWDQIFQLEAQIIHAALPGVGRVLSVGCGTCAVEKNLTKRGHRVMGLDPEGHLLGNCRPEVIGIQGRAEHLPFRDECFSAAVFVTSLNFMSDPEQALEEALRVLRPAGVLLLLLLNPEDLWIQSQRKRKSSYISLMKAYRAEEWGSWLEGKVRMWDHTLALGRTPRGVALQANQSTHALLQVVCAIR